MRRFAIGITGASGVIYGVRLLEALRRTEGVETHLVLTDGAKKTLGFETDLTPEDVEALAHRVHRVDDLGAPLASGSFPVEAMAVVPCSMKTLSSIARSYGDNLLTRAADVTLKEGRTLVLCPRETPLHKGHLKLLWEAADLGARIVPPMVAFYPRPRTVEEIVDQTVGKILDQLGVEHALFRRWEGK
jgi:4-hydroxy-3-polyprenylbenzoate decarboxylase